ncbi:M20/M25/M40 family metallo-hydrolase [Deinococcus radiophilus]|uniref:M20/M25/M40 family metallo-hydrolase n=1 Tax=Deinococcus radiophilus TaxID=32062 RepID=A0A3S0I8Z4_9DEIO|nr:M20/M25/M40 family metallo-hydrolase [Deinococcus radiophilus]RTR30231.1 M20/M25/M40 family metallo-hydrolase [Deinococcus radiophilus]UFA49979.1 M20/M25/M40 family metallo-hydrolase [Deinococcus radiophilus]
MPLEFLVRIAQTPAPTFAEGARASLITQLWRDLGYHPQTDAVGNVLVKIDPPSAGASGRGPLMLASHLDTVFPAQTDVRVQQQVERWSGPGLGDNSSSLAVLTALLRDLDHRTLRAPLWVAANVGEEGLGDLRGAKYLLAEHARELGAFVAVDGYLGSVVTQAVGVRRYQATFHGGGGHSWGEAVPSAVHALGEAVRDLYALPRPTQPRTTLNVGVVSGGSSVNSIAAQASLLLDLRSLGSQELQELDHQAVATLHGAARRVGVRLDLERVGDRPGGLLNTRELLPLAHAAAQRVGVTLREAASSTDANAAAPYGLPTLSLGVYRGGHAHREDEWVDPHSHAQGLGLLQAFIANYQR